MLAIARAKWIDALEDLAKASEYLKRSFGRIHLTQAPDGFVRVGLTDGSKFSRMLRTANAAEALEGATGSKLSLIQRRAVRAMDNQVRAAFPDVTVITRNEYLTRVRIDLKIPSGKRMNSVENLERVVRNSSELSGDVSKAVRKAKRTKTWKYLGGTVAVGAVVSAASLYAAAVELAKRNTGCFMYRGGGQHVTKCRVKGCSCPLNPGDVQACDESVLWDVMKIANSDCPTGSEENSCVHCNWNETNAENVHYIDRDKVPHDAFFQCEHHDALDAINEIISGTLGNVWNRTGDLISGSSDSIRSISSFLPYILAFVGLIVLVAVGAWLFRIAKSVSPSSVKTDNAIDSSSVR